MGATGGALWKTAKLRLVLPLQDWGGGKFQGKKKKGNSMTEHQRQLRKPGPDAVSGGKGKASKKLGKFLKRDISSKVL